MYIYMQNQARNCLTYTLCTVFALTATVIVLIGLIGIIECDTLCDVRSTQSHDKLHPVF